MSVLVSASDALTAVLVRTFAMLRVLGVVTTALYLALWWSWYSPGTRWGSPRCCWCSCGGLATWR